jgi:beta-phosphoglucomutase
MQEPFAIIFDMDGVIIDSNPAITKAWKLFFDEHAIALTEEQLHQYVFGRTAKDTIRLVFGGEMTADELEAYEMSVTVNVKQLYQEESSIVAGITEFARLLAKSKVPMAIATSAPAENVKIVLKLADITPYFSVISDASHVQFSKPHPEIYLKTAARLGIEPSRCLVFEDSVSGVQAARAAGMKVIGLTTTHSAGELGEMTDAVIADFTAIDLAQIGQLMDQPGLS